MILNKEKTDYHIPSLFFGQKMGILDSIHKHYPDIWNLYKKLKFLDWSEDEFDFKSCNQEFKNCTKSDYDAMIKTLAWQWEADSIVGRSIISILTPFISSSELFTAWYYVAQNENLHSLTYSEIVRNSFDDPEVVLKEILEIKEAFARLDSVEKIFSDLAIKSSAYQLGLVQYSETLYLDLLKFIVALFCLERIQFMASFAITFSFAESGMFIPIGKAVQKICQDELEVHVEIDKAVLKHEFENKIKRELFLDNQNQFKNIIDEVVESEINWVDFLFNDSEIIGLNSNLLKSWVLWCAQDVYDFLNIKSDFEKITRSPLPFMDNWIVNNHQASPQEDRPTNYMLGGIVDDLGNQIINFEI